MYEISLDLQNYYREVDPKKRLEILNAMPENEDSEYLQWLYHDRYSDHDNKGRQNVDWWLWRCVCLQSLYMRSSFFKRFRKREVNNIIQELHTEDNSHRNFLYHEYRNTAKRYLSTCKSSGYASSFMGFRQASDDEKIIRACSDIWQMSAGIAHKEGVIDRMQLWIEAFRDELFDYDSICRREYERLSNK